MGREDLEETLRTGAEEAGLQLSAGTLDLAVRHLALLLEWNGRVNLCGEATPQEIVRRHFVESFVAAELMGPPLRGPADRLRMLDVGAGAGFPGLPARALRPEIELTLLEARARKAAFLSLVAAVFPEPVPSVRVGQLQDLPRDPAWDCLAFRAVVLPVGELACRLAPRGRLVTFGPAAGTDRQSRSLAAAGFRPVEERMLAGGARLVRAWTREA